MAYGSVAITEGSGDKNLAADTISAVEFPRYKVVFGVEGSAVDASAANPFPVDGSGVIQPVSASSLPLPTGAATQETLASLAADIISLLESMGEQTPFSGTVSTSGDNTIIAAPGAGNRLVIDTWDIASAAAVTVLLKFGATAFMVHPFDGGTDYLRWSGPVRWVLPENTAFVGNLSDAQSVTYYGLYHVETV